MRRIHGGTARRVARSPRPRPSADYDVAKPLRRGVGQEFSRPGGGSVWAWPAYLQRPAGHPADLDVVTRNAATPPAGRRRLPGLAGRAISDGSPLALPMVRRATRRA